MTKTLTKISLILAIFFVLFTQGSFVVQAQTNSQLNPEVYEIFKRTLNNQGTLTEVAAYGAYKKALSLPNATKETAQEQAKLAVTTWENEKFIDGYVAQGDQYSKSVSDPANASVLEARYYLANIERMRSWYHKEYADKNDEQKNAKMVDFKRELMELGMSEKDAIATVAEIRNNPTGETTVEIEKKKITNSSTCNIFTNPWQCVLDAVEYVVVGIANLILFIYSWITWVAGVFLNLVLEKTVIGMKGLVKDITAIKAGWMVFRDLANLFFIFILLYIAIKTILGGGSYQTKDMLVKVVIVGLLINFSLFFTNVIIDSSNILTIHFFNKIGTVGQDPNLPKPDEGNPLIKEKKALDGGLSGAMFNSLKLTSIFDKSGESSKPAGIEKWIAVYIRTVAGVILLIIAAFIFFTAAILFVIRFVILIFLMVVSPLAFAAHILPKTKAYWDQWFQALMDQCIFAPVYMALTWFSIEVITIVNGVKGIGDAGKEGFSGAFSSGGNVSVIGIFLNYAIVATFLISTIIIAKKLGAAGAGLATGFSGAMTFGAAALVTKGMMKAPGGTARTLAKVPAVGWAGKQLETARTFAGDKASVVANKVGLNTITGKASGVIQNVKNSRVIKSAGTVVSEAGKYADFAGAGVAREKIGLVTSTLGQKAKSAIRKSRENLADTNYDLRNFSIGGSRTFGKALEGFGIDTGKATTAKEAARARDKAEKEENEATSRQEFEKNKQALNQAVSTGDLTKIKTVLKDMSEKDISKLDRKELENENLAQALVEEGKLEGAIKDLPDSIKEALRNKGMSGFDKALEDAGKGNSAALRNILNKLGAEPLAKHLERGLKNAENDTEKLKAIVDQLDQNDLIDIAGKVKRKSRRTLYDEIAKNPNHPAYDYVRFGPTDGGSRKKTSQQAEGQAPASTPAPKKIIGPGDPNFRMPPTK